MLDFIKVAKLVSLIDSYSESCTYTCWKRNTNSVIITFSFEKYIIYWDTQWRGWLRYYATSRKDSGSFPHGHMVSCRIVNLLSTQPLTEVSTRGVPGGKGGRCVRLTTLPPSCADRLEILGARLPFTTLYCKTAISISYA